MAKNHGARQQKRVAKQKAKRSAKRTLLQRLTSKDPTTRLQHAGSWPVVKALVGAALWDEGIGYMAMPAREFIQVDLVVLAILIYALLGKLADTTARALERRCLSWHPTFQIKA